LSVTPAWAYASSVSPWVARTSFVAAVALAGCTGASRATPEDASAPADATAQADAAMSADDATPPDAAASSTRVLVFDGCIPPPLGYCHASIAAGAQALTEIGAAEGMTVDVSSDPAVFAPATLAPYAVVAFLSTDVMNGPLKPFDPWSAPQNPNYMASLLSSAEKAAFEQYMGGGGNYVGIHSATDGDYYWPFYVDMLGAMFTDHSTPNVFQTASIDVEDPTHPATSALPPVWTRADEWYDFDKNPRDVARVLLRLDETTYAAGPKACVADHPLAWCRVYNGSRVFYTALGHTDTSYAEPAFRAHLRGALRWAAGLDAGDCTPRAAPAALPAGTTQCASVPCYPGCRCATTDAGAAACQAITGHDGMPAPNCGTMLCGAGCSCADAGASACACP
jgi:type 1 glutamine amidotransferase